MPERDAWSRSAIEQRKGHIVDRRVEVRMAEDIEEVGTAERQVDPVALSGSRCWSRGCMEGGGRDVEGGFVDPSEQDDPYSRSGSQGGQRNTKVDQDL